METFPIRRNTVLLAATLTCLSGMVQLAVAVATITLVLVTGHRGDPRARAGDLPRRGRRWRRCRPERRWTARPDPGAGGRLRARESSGAGHRARLRARLRRARHRRLRARRVGQRDGPARQSGRGGHVSARAPCARHLLRPVRRALRRGARPARLPAALRREGPRPRRARHPVARGGRDHGGRARARPVRPPRSEEDRARTSPATPLRRSRRHRRRRCARSSAARESSRRWWRPWRASRAWSR